MLSVLRGRLPVARALRRGCLAGVVRKMPALAVVGGLSTRGVGGAVTAARCERLSKVDVKVTLPHPHPVDGAHHCVLRSRCRQP